MMLFGGKQTSHPFTVYGTDFDLPVDRRFFLIVQLEFHEDQISPFQNRRGSKFHQDSGTRDIENLHKPMLISQKAHIPAGKVHPFSGMFSALQNDAKRMAANTPAAKIRGWLRAGLGLYPHSLFLIAGRAGEYHPIFLVNIFLVFRVGWLFCGHENLPFSIVPFDVL